MTEPVFVSVFVSLIGAASLSGLVSGVKEIWKGRYSMSLLPFFFGTYFAIATAAGIGYLWSLF